MKQPKEASIELLIHLGNYHNASSSIKSKQWKGEELIKETKLNVEEVNDAVNILVKEDLIKLIKYKSPPFVFGAVLINTQGKEAYLNIISQKNNNKVKVFISHSSKDKSITKKIITLLRAGLNLEAQDIRATSVSGYKLEPGVNTDEQLKKEVFSSELLIGIITENSIKSSYVLFELGARWGAQLPMIPLICDSKKGVSILSGPLKNINCLLSNDKGDIHSMIKKTSEILSIQLQPTSSYIDIIDEIEYFDQDTSLTEKADISKNEFTNNESLEDVKNIIKEKCSIKWANNHEMVLYCIEQQLEAYQKYINYQAPDIEAQKLSKIKYDAEAKWPNNYEMILYTIDEQVNSVRKLKEI